MSSDFAGTETMLNPDHRVGGGEIHWKRQLLECKQSLCSWIRLQRKGGKPFNRLASYTRNDLQKGGNGCLVTPSFLYEGGVC